MTHYKKKKKQYLSTKIAPLASDNFRIRFVFVYKICFGVDSEIKTRLRLRFTDSQKILENYRKTVCVNCEVSVSRQLPTQSSTGTWREKLCALIYNFLTLLEIYCCFWTLNFLHLDWYLLLLSNLKCIIRTLLSHNIVDDKPYVEFAGFVWSEKNI